MPHKPISRHFGLRRKDVPNIWNLGERGYDVPIGDVMKAHAARPPHIRVVTKGVYHFLKEFQVGRVKGVKGIPRFSFSNPNVLDLVPAPPGVGEGYRLRKQLRQVRGGTRKV